MEYLSHPFTLKGLVIDICSTILYTIKHVRYFGVDHVVNVNLSGELIRTLLGDSKRF